jgi:hypothetical protein
MAKSVKQDPAAMGKTQKLNATQSLNASGTAGFDATIKTDKKAETIQGDKPATETADAKPPTDAAASDQPAADQPKVEEG